MCLLQIGVGVRYSVQLVLTSIGRARERAVPGPASPDISDEDDGLGKTGSSTTVPSHFEQLRAGDRHSGGNLDPAQDLVGLDLPERSTSPVLPLAEQALREARQVLLVGKEVLRQARRARHRHELADALELAEVIPPPSAVYYSLRPKLVRAAGPSSYENSGISATNSSEGQIHIRFYQLKTDKKSSQYRSGRRIPQKLQVGLVSWLVDIAAVATSSGLNGTVSWRCGR